MNLPVRYKDNNFKCVSYMKYDDNYNPEYIFVVNGREITKFIPLKDGVYGTIVLPKLVEGYEFMQSSTGEKTISNSSPLIQKNAMRNYITGHIKIAEGCFEGIKHAKIIVPFEDSIMLDWSSFDSDANIELILPQNLSLKQIYRQFDTGFDYENENWTLIGDKNIAGSFEIKLKEFYRIQDYEKYFERKVANFSISRIGKDNQIHKEQNDYQI